jgi:gliding motility-associated-like protein
MAEHVRLSQVAHSIGNSLVRSFRTLLAVATVVLLWQTEAQATHAMGGELTYECIGPNLYRVRLNFYRDCNGVAAPSNCTNGRQFRMRSTQCGATINPCFGLEGVEIVTPICLSAVDRCNSSQGQFGIQRFRYSTVVDLSQWAGCGTDWIIDWDLCCRNNAITSLNNPGSRNLYLTATLNNTLQPCNNSPRYLNDPTPFACVGQSVSYNHGFNDVDGDSLSFELAPALGSNGSLIPYNPGYSFLQPIVTTGGANAVQINPVTGTITFVPSIQQFAVVTVRVREWRGGVQIGSYLRDVQFAIIACANNNPQVTGINGTGQFTATICANETITFTVPSSDADAGQTVTMTWNNGIPGATFNVGPGPLPVGTFSWTPTAANIGPNLFSVTVQDDACSLNGVNNFGFVVQVTPPFTPANAGPDQNVCGLSTTLEGVLPYPQTPGQWTVVSGTGTFANAALRNTAVSGLTPGPNVFRWTVNYGTCGITSDEVTITAFNPAQPAANAGPNQSLCLPTTSTTLAANIAAAPAVGTWTVVNGTGVFANANSPTSTVSGLSAGTNVFRWTIDNGACTPPTGSQVTILVFSNTQPAANAGPDQQLCAPGATATLAGNATIAPATGQWSVVSGTATFANASVRNTTVSGLSIGVNTLRWTINNGPCDPSSTQDEVNIVVFDPASPNANAGPAQQVCTAITTLAGNAPIAPATGQWTLVSGSGTITTPSSPGSTVTGLGIGTNVFQWTLNNGPCANGITTSQVTITRFDAALAPATAGPAQDLCTAGATGLASTTLAGNTAVAPASGAWSVVSGPAGAVITTPASATSTVTNLAVGTHVLRWTINNGPCTPPSTNATVTIRVFDRNAAVANAGPAQQLCAPVASVALAANAAVAPAAGTWSVVSGTGTFANASSPTTTVSGMGIGDNVYRWTIVNGPCPGATTTSDVTIRLFDPAAPAAAAGTDQQLCATATTTLAATPVAFPATGTWTLVSGTGTIVNPASATSSVTGIGVGVSVFRWTVNNGPCGNSTDEVSIARFDENNPTANAGPDQSICVPVAPNQVSMAASNVIFPATGTWAVVSGGGTITNPNSPTTTVTNMPVGINEFSWTVSNGPCANSLTSDIVRILVFDAGTPVADAGPDQSLCTTNGSTVMAGSSVASPATGQWVLVSGTGTLTDPASPTTAVTGLGVGQNIFQWTVNNGPCANGLTTDQMSIFVYDPNNPSANAGGDQSLCTSVGNTITLEGSNVIFPATGLWTVTGGVATIVDPTNPTTLVTGLGTGSYTFSWTVNNGVCPNPITSSTSIVVVADGNAQPADAGPDQSVCGASTTVVMAANAPTGVATGSWSVVQGTASFSSATSNTATVSGLSVGVNVLRWSIDNVECGITSDLVSIFVFDPNNPVASAGADQQLCTPTTSTTLNGSALIVPAVGQWTLVSGSGTIANPNSATTGISGLGIGENVFRWQVNNGACPNPITNDLVSVFVFEQDAPAANAGPDQEVCTPTSSVNMAANSPVGSAVGTWSIIIGGGTITDPNGPNTSITALPVGINVFAWTIDNGVCGTTVDQVSILVFDDANPVADAGADQELCTPNTSTNLQGSALTSPATGLWTLISGTGSIADETDPNSAVSGLSIGENVFEWTVSNGPCANGVTSSTVSIFVFDENNPVADAGADQEFCTPTASTTLNGSALTFPATGQWTIVSGTGVIADPTASVTTISGFEVGETVCRWTVSNGPCANGTTTDDVSIFLFDADNADADAGPDQELCTPASSTTLAGSAVIFPASGTWTLVSGTGTIVDPNAPNSAVTDLEVGENIFEWTVDNGPCANGITADRVSIFVFDENNADADAGADQELCTPTTSTTLDGSPVTFPAIGTWTVVSGQGTFADANSPTSTVSGLAVGQNIFRWTVDNGPCANGVTEDEVSIFLFNQSNPVANAGPDQELCTPNTSTTLQGSSVIFPAEGTWTLVSGQGVIVSPNDPNSAVTGLAVGANVFEWTVSNGPCDNGITTSQVTIFLFQAENLEADAGVDQELCTPNTTSSTLSGSSVIFPAVGTWTLVQGTGTIADANSPVTQVFDLSIGENIFEWTVDNGPCATGITTDQVSIFVFDANNQNADAGASVELCTPVAGVQLNASPVTFPSVGTWTLVQGTGVITDPLDPNTTFTSPGVGLIVLEWSVDNGACPNGITSDQMLITLYDENNPEADAGADQQLCTPDEETQLQGSNVIFPAVGTWTLVQGTGTPTDANDPNTTVTGLTVGENIFLWTVDNGVCDNAITTDLVSIFVFDENNPDANAGPDQQVCTPVTNTLMAGSAITFPAEGTWTLISGQGTIVDPNDPLTEITDLGIGDNIFEWTVFNGACANSLTTDQVTIVLFDADAPPADAGPDQEICAPDDTVTLTGNPTVGSAVGTWTLVQGTGTIASANEPVTNVSDLTVGENIFAWTIESGDCVTTTDQVSIFVFDPDNLDAFAGLDQELCIPQDSVFMAGSAVIFPAGGTWIVVSGTGDPVDPNDPNTLIEGLSIGVNTFQWEVYNGPCANGTTIDLVTVILYDDTTAAANAGPDLETCIPVNSITMQGETPPPPAVGTWTLIAGTGTIVDPNDPNTVINDLSQGINTFVWNLVWDPCPNNGILSDTVSVFLYDPNAPLADAGPDQELCTPDIDTNLAGNTPAIPGVGTWTVLQGSSTVVDVNDPNSAVTGLEVGVHTFLWTIYNGQCGFGPPSTDTVQIFVFDGDAPLAQTGNDISWCTPTNSAVLQANDPIFPGVGTWTSLSGTGDIADANDPNTAVFNLGVGQHDYLWTIDNGACGISSDTISVFIFDGESDDANAGADQELCTPNTSATLAGNAPVFPATGSWELVAGTGVFTDATDPATTVTGLSIGTNTFRWTIDNEPCGTTDDEVTITVFDEDQPSANAGPDQQLCTPTNSTTLQGSPVTFPATGTWVFVSGTGFVSDPNSPTSTLSGLAVGEVVLQWVVDNGPCANGVTTDEVTIQVFDGNTQASAAGPDQSYCTPINDPVTMFASSVPFPGVGTWTLTGGAGTIADVNDPFTAITGLGLGNNSFTWTIDNGACGSSSDDIDIVVFDHTVPPADAGPNQQFCQDVNTTTLEAVPATSTATGFWSLLSGNLSTIVQPGDPESRVDDLRLGDNWFIWTVDNGTCGTTTDTMLVFIKDCLTIRIPDSFSPNGDGTNDTFVIPNIESYPKNRFQVFNRWGSKVLDQSPYTSDWDGESQFGAAFGEKLPESTYYYVLDLGDGSDAYTGFIYLRR